MDLVVDIGNTCIKFGLCDNEKIIGFFRFALDKFIDYSFLENKKINNVIVASVNDKRKRFILRQLQKQVSNRIIDLDNYRKSIKINAEIDEDIEKVGIDLIADLLAASKLYKTPAIIFDIGTVSKILVLSKNRSFIGASFFPSIEISLKTLNSNTALLPLTNFYLPKQTYGKNTAECICSGVYYSAIFAIEGYINNFKKQFGENVSIIFTGGAFLKLKSYFKSYIHNENLTLLGIYYIYKEISHEL